MKYIGLFPINGIETLKNDKTNQICEGFTGVLCGDDFLLSWLITRTCFVPRSDVVVCRLATSETVSSLSVMATGYNSAYYVHKHPPPCTCVRSCARKHAHAFPSERTKEGRFRRAGMLHGCREALSLLIERRAGALSRAVMNENEGMSTRKESWIYY